MPFSKYIVDPARIEPMRTAFYRASKALQPDGADDDGIMTELIVLKIMELAAAGELDPDRLYSQVLLELGEHSTPSALRNIP
jgi:hypothetical protein